jgi:transcriptional regulator with XRE-family HTH domain
LIDWSVENLAEASGVSIATISRLERGNYGKGRNSSHDAVMRALERGGIAFERNYQGIPGISLRLTTGS